MGILGKVGFLRERGELFSHTAAALVGGHEEPLESLVLTQGTWTGSRAVVLDSSHSHTTSDTKCVGFPLRASLQFSVDAN